MSLSGGLSRPRPRRQPPPHTRSGRAETMPTTERDRLRQMLLERSMQFGEFVLSSGATSNYYIDVRKTSLHPQGLALISRMFWEILERDQITAVGGLTMGADPLVAGLMLHASSHGTPLEGFLVRRTA